MACDKVSIEITVSHSCPTRRRPLVRFESLRDAEAALHAAYSARLERKTNRRSSASRGRTRELQHSNLTTRTGLCVRSRPERRMPATYWQAPAAVVQFDLEPPEVESNGTDDADSASSYLGMHTASRSSR